MPRETIYHLITYVIILFVCSKAAAQDTTIERVINQYARVATINGNVVTLSSLEESQVMFGNSSSYDRQDTVLLIQMTGISALGHVNRGAGRYEFHIVKNVVGSTVTLSSIVDQSDVGFQFDPVNEIVQMIRVPTYRNAVINQEHTCSSFDWAKGTGGVLALFVQDLLTVNADINVSGRGFNGGKTYYSTTVECIPTTPSPLDKADLPATSDDAGYKGEGAIEKRIYESYPKGYAKTWNGGGGGIGKWSGGGGGANGRDGGSGGNQFCDFAGWVDGNFGTGIKYNELDNVSKYAYMGGGGGAGTGISGAKGGNGGGIVIIVAKNMEFYNDSWIKSAGSDVTEVSRQAGAGGGGGGGTILLSVRNYRNMKVDISGGNGGDVFSDETSCNAANTGVGGGGSGGYLLTMENNTDRSWYNNPDSLNTNFGTFGKIITTTLPNCNTGRQQDGNLGKNDFGFKVQLSGFLNNYILAPDAICYYESYTPSTIQASDPLAGTGDYIYEWFSSSDGANWVAIEDAHERDLVYWFTKEIWLQRKVSSGNVIDYGLPVRIRMYDRITNQIHDDAFCWDEKITVAGDKITGGGGNIQNYTYLWKEQQEDLSWKPVDLTSQNKEEELSFTLKENPSAILTYYFKREVTSSAGCKSESNIATIHIHRSIEGNTIDGDMEFCEDKSLILTASEPTGGDDTNNPRYEWQIKASDNTWLPVAGDNTWLPAAGVNDQKDYTPGIGDGNREFRRSVQSGKCSDDSKSVVIYSKSHSEILTEPDTLFLQFSKELIAVPPKFGSGVWSSSNQNMIFNPDPPEIPNVIAENMKMGTYIFTWTVKNGVCDEAKSSVEIIVKDISFPKGFSPNGDVYNNCFRIMGAENVYKSRIVIFDRYNNIVYEDNEFGKKGSSSYEKNKDCTGWWDGSDKRGNDLPSGVYYYRYFYQLEGDINEKVKNGYVVLRR